MKLKMSFYKKSLIVSDLKRFWWVSALYAIALFFALPFNHYIQKFYMNQDQFNWLKESITRDLTFRSSPSQTFLLVVPIVIGALVFRFMQKNRSTSLYHSLPLTRTALFFHEVLSGAILFVLPLLFTTLVMFLLNGFSYLAGIYSAELIFGWLLYSLLFGILFLMMSIFVGMFTGNSVAQLAFIYILNLLPMFLVEFVRMNLRKLLFGFDTYSNVDFYNKMPMLMLFRVTSEDFTPILVIVYIAVTLLLLFAGLLAFKIRRPETAGDIITFRPIKPLFIYGVTTCATLLGGSYFLDISGSTLSIGIFGYFMSSVVSYTIVQMITNKSFKVLHTYKGYLGFSLVLVILALGIKFDFVGYINKVPAPSEVQEAYVGYNLQWWQNKDNPDFNEKLYGNDDSNSFKNPENIEYVTKLHKMILENRSTTGSSQYVAYKLKNGKQIIRRYIVDTDSYASALGPLYESAEYKEDRFPVVKQNEENIKYIEISDNRSEKNSVIVSDKAKLKDFIAALRKDVESISYNDLIDPAQRAINIMIVDTSDTTINYEVRSGFTNTLTWLKQEEIYDQIVLRPEDVDSAVINYYDYKKAEVMQETASVKSVEIKDKEVIKELIDISFDIHFDYKDGTYDVAFMSKGQRTKFNLALDVNAKVSPALKSYLDQLK